MFTPRRRAAASALTLFLGLAGAAPSAAQPPDDLALVPVFGLSPLVGAVALRHAGDGSGRLFVVERAGRVLVWNGVDAPAVFLDVAGLVDDTGGEQGLLGLAFHPDYASNGYFYVNYTRDPGPGLDRTVIARYRVSAGDPDLADPGSASVLLEIEQDFGNHNGGNLLFGPDGYLYVGMGDGGSGNDPLNRAQDLGSLLGKMLRLDVDGTPPAGQSDLCGLSPAYGIPPDNPFAGGAGDCDEIWSLGLRNPWRWSFDRFTGDLFLGDVGQDTMEEISLQPAGIGGLNFGWSCKEGTLDQNFNGCLPQTLTPPILTYLQTEDEVFIGCAVTGGYRYRGSGIVGLQGTYVYADYCTGTIWLATEGAGGGWSSLPWGNAFFNVTSFGEDERGELYAVGPGQVHRFVSPSSIFTDGFESGDVSSWSTGP